VGNKKNITSGPYLRSKVSTNSIMLAVIIALLPAAGFGIYNFGYQALLLILVTVGTCVITEFLYEVRMKKKITITDCSAIVTGLLLAMCLPPSAPWWIGVIGGVFAILVVKMLFGGIGKNFMNPALGARCFLLLSFTSIMTNYEIDGFTGPTPLKVLRDGGDVDLMSMITGHTAGTIGETSMIALMLGGCILLLCGVIDLRIPGTYIASFILFICVFGGHGVDYYYISAQLAGGGLLLGAFFMATDYTTRPITIKGQYVYGVLLGVLTGTFRIYGASTEGVAFAIIFANLMVPLIEKITYPKGIGRGVRRV